MDRPGIAVESLLSIPVSLATAGEWSTHLPANKALIVQMNGSMSADDNKPCKPCSSMLSEIEAGSLYTNYELDHRGASHAGTYVTDPLRIMS